MDDILLKRGNAKLTEEKIKIAFSHMYRELDEHLDTINVNSSEIQSNYEYLCEQHAAKLPFRLSDPAGFRALMSQLGGGKRGKKKIINKFKKKRGR